MPNDIEKCEALQAKLASGDWTIRDLPALQVIALLEIAKQLAIMNQMRAEDLEDDS